MAVVEASDGMTVIADHVFVIPPNATMLIKDGCLSVSKPAPPREHRRPIDTFFSSLADDQGENAVSIVLAGTGSDGALGLGAIKEKGGFTIAQAEYDHTALQGMPHNAVATGFVDEVMPAGDMPAKLVAYWKTLRQAAAFKQTDGTRRDTAQYLAPIATLLRSRVGHDFANYKEKTVARRIQRRMQVLQVNTVPEFIARLKEEPRQLDLLFRDLLIGVTSFFRDPQAFAALRAVLDQIVETKSANDTIRIWVPGCATGEEVYSIAILLRGAMLKAESRAKVQIFGTDLDENAIAVARAGRYAKTTGVSPYQVERWFVRDGADYCPIREIREMCIFSVQSIIRDPPFSKLDLISCRNLLIYLDADLQEKVLHMFHYSLNASGYLFLGPSEGINRQTLYFGGVNNKHRIFRRLSKQGEPHALRLHERAREPSMKQKTRPLAVPRDDQIARKARQVMEKHSPAYLVIDKNAEILTFSGGEVGRYLEPSFGAASLNLYTILRKALRHIVREAVSAALGTNEPVVRASVAVRIEGRNRLICVIAERISSGSNTGLCLIAFQEVASIDSTYDDKDAPDARVQAVEHELRTVKAQLQSTIDELETASEDMKSAAEEYQSINEELQSSNEELETAKEEMQSINEELQTINAELAAKNDALTRLNSDINNLLDSTEIATLFLDSDLRIKSFTPKMTDIFHLRETDQGRPITDIVGLLDYSELKRDVNEVLRSLAPLEREVQLKDAGMAFILRMRPYRTVDDRIDGVVLTFMDISERKRGEDHAALLLGELDHRVKNILAIVSTIIAQTLKTSETPAAFADSMKGRIAAIARAHSTFTSNGVRGNTSIRSIIEEELAPFGAGTRFTLEGPDVFLEPKAGLTFAMAIHELASNASKYGSLSTQNGHVAVNWSTPRSGNVNHLKLNWLEMGGPNVTSPRRAGFGTTLIERTIKYDLDGTVTREFHASGLRCSIQLPLVKEIGYLSKRNGTRDDDR